MKKIKQFGLKAMLLTIVAALTIGFTGCSDELSGDQTQDKPGYLTINLKTLQPKQTKVGGDGANDYETINDLNIFVFNSAGSRLTQKYYPTLGVTTGSSSVTIQVSTLPADAYVVAVANYGGRIDEVTTVEELEAVEVETVRNFATLGLHMTGKANIETLANGSYNTNVKIAPIESKITVSWTLSGDVAGNYDVTGVYVVNAINKTQLPIIRNNNYSGTAWDATASNILPAGFINFPDSRTASTGLAGVGGRDFNFYTGMTTDATNLNDEVSAVDASLTSPLHYYMGENYSNNTLPDAAAGAILADNTTNANTLVVIRVTPKSTAPSDISALGVRYYTYEFDKSSGTVNNTNLGTGVIGPDATGVGFSVRRKTNYNLAFSLSSIGTANPYERLKTLTVNVTAEAWDD